MKVLIGDIIKNKALLAGHKFLVRLGDRNDIPLWRHSPPHSLYIVVFNACDVEFNHAGKIAVSDRLKVHFSSSGMVFSIWATQGSDGAGDFEWYLVDTEKELNDLLETEKFCYALKK